MKLTISSDAMPGGPIEVDVPDVPPREQSKAVALTSVRAKIRAVYAGTTYSNVRVELTPVEAAVALSALDFYAKLETLAGPPRRSYR